MRLKINTIRLLEEQISKATEILASMEKNISLYRDSIVYPISINHMKEHIEELQSQLRFEREKREKEILEIHLQGPFAEYGQISLSTLGNIAKSLSSALLSISHRLKAGKGARGQIPQEIIDTINLKFAGISPGSTRIFISGNTAPDLFGYSIFENSLDNTFRLLNLESQGEISETVNRVGHRAAKNINEFVKTLLDSKLEADLLWTTSTNKKRRWIGNKEKILTIINTLDDIASFPPKKIEIRGELIGANLHGRFEILGRNNQRFKGSFPSDLKEKIKTLHLGTVYDYVIEEEVVYNKATDSEKRYYTLISIE